MTRGLAEGTFEASRAPVLEEHARRRLGFSGIAAVAIVLALLVLLPSAPAPGRHVPTSLGTGPEDFLAFQRTLDALGLPAREYLSTYGALPEADDHLLVTLAPSPPARSDGGEQRMDASQVRALDAWLHAGGVWLIALPQGRTGSEGDPLADGAFEPTSDPDDPLSLITDLPATRWVPANGLLTGYGELADLTADFEAPTPLAGPWPAALREHPDGAPQLRAFSDAGDGWTSLLELGRRPLALHRPTGAGTLVLVSTPLLFDNLGLGAVRTGPLAIRILHFAADRGRRRTLIDEFGHGLMHDRGLWWIARRHGFGGLLLALVALLGVLGWRGAVRRSPPIPPDTVSRRAAGEFVVALADIARRTGRAKRSAERFLDGQELIARRRGDRDTLRRLAALRAELPLGGRFGAEQLQALVRRVDQLETEASPHHGDRP